MRERQLKMAQEHLESAQQPQAGSPLQPTTTSNALRDLQQAKVRAHMQLTATHG